MFDVYNCYYKPSNMISYIICVSLFTHDKDLLTLIQIIYDIRHHNINYITEEEKRVFLFNDNVISEIFRYLSIISKSNIVDLSFRNIEEISTRIDYNNEDIKSSIKNFNLMMYNLNFEHIPESIQSSLSTIKTKNIKKDKPIYVGSLDIHHKINNIFTQRIFTIGLDYINSLYFKIHIFNNGEKEYLNIGKNSMNKFYLHTNSKSDNYWYFIKKNNTDRTCNFSKNKIIPINYREEYDGFLVISNDNKYLLTINKPEDLFDSLDEWNKYKTSKIFRLSKMVITRYNNTEYILNIIKRDDYPDNYIYLTKHDDSFEV